MFENEEDTSSLQDLLNDMHLAGEAYGEGKFRTGWQSPLFGSLSVNSEPFTLQTEQGNKSFFL